MTFSLKNVYCSVPGKVLFNELSYEFKEQGVNLLVGANGAGKSTILNLIRGQTRSYSKIDGMLLCSSQIYHLADEKRPKIGYVVQNYADMLVSTLTVKQNLQAACLYPRPGLSFLPDISLQAVHLEKLGISLGQSLKSLSGGQQQILAIIMTLKQDLDILLLDEPTAALDEENTELVMSFLQILSQKQHCSLLMVTHDQKLIQKASADHVFRLNRHL